MLTLPEALPAKSSSAAGGGAGGGGVTAQAAGEASSDYGEYEDEDSQRAPGNLAKSTAGPKIPDPYFEQKEVVIYVAENATSVKLECPVKNYDGESLEEIAKYNIFITLFFISLESRPPRHPLVQGRRCRHHRKEHCEQYLRPGQPVHPDRAPDGLQCQGSEIFVQRECLVGYSPQGYHPFWSGAKHPGSRYSPENHLHWLVAHPPGHWPLAAGPAALGSAPTVGVLRPLLKRAKFKRPRKNRTTGITFGDAHRNR